MDCGGKYGRLDVDSGDQTSGGVSGEICFPFGRSDRSLKLIPMCTSKAELEYAINVFLDRLAMVDAQKIISKAKCHILTHIIEDIRRFGPAITLSTETFESFNAVFRRCSTLSNHQAPSKDIAYNMADIDRFKHLSSGGKWYKDREWVEPGEDLTMFFSRHDELQKMMGWSEPPQKKTGSYNNSLIHHIDLISFTALKVKLYGKPGKVNSN